MNGKTQNPPPWNEDASNVLLLAPAGNPAETDACIDLLLPTEPASVNVLSVTLSKSPGERITDWREHLGEASPAAIRIIAGGETMRSSASQAGDVNRLTAFGTPVEITAVSDSGDLAAIGIAMNDSLSEWAHEGNQIAVCFHSLTPILEDADLERVFRFLHIICWRIAAIDAIAHYHLDPTRLDKETVDTLEPLFDRIVDLRTGGVTQPPNSEEISVIEDGGEEFLTQIDAGESPSEAVVRAVAVVEGTDPIDLDLTLNDAVDPDALDSLLSSVGTPAETELRIEFRLGAYQISVNRNSVSITL